MPTTEDMNSILEDIDEAHSQISRLRESIRAHRVTHPEADTPALDAALDYWEGQKNDAELKLRRLSR